MPKSPLVSVIVPNYNYGRFLKQRIETILMQTLRDIEIILLDDASTDDSVEVMKEYASEPRVECIEVNKTNSGSPFAQWLKGIKMARGKWIWIAEADDFSSTTFLEQCLKALEAHPTAVAAYTGSTFVDENGNHLDQEANYYGHATGCVCFDGTEFAAHNLYWHCCIQNTSAAIFRRDVALSHLPDLSFAKMRYAGDWLFWIEMALVGPIIEIRTDANFFRQHTSKQTVKGKCDVRSIEEDIYIRAYLNSHLRVGPYKRRLALGMVARKIRHLSVSNEKKRHLFDQLRKEAGGKKFHLHLLHLNQYLRLVCPWLPTMKRDKLIPKGTPIKSLNNQCDLSK